jgi:hypothetical protein
VAGPPFAFYTLPLLRQPRLLEVRLPLTEEVRHPPTTAEARLPSMWFCMHVGSKRQRGEGEPAVVGRWTPGPHLAMTLAG